MALTLATLEPFPFPLIPQSLKILRVIRVCSGVKVTERWTRDEKEGSDATVSSKAAATAT
jgi:hypothetical protein